MKNAKEHLKITFLQNSAVSRMLEYFDQKF